MNLRIRTPFHIIILLKYYLLTESEVITGKSQTEALMYSPVMTERARLISHLLYGLFSAILKKNTLKTPEAIFHIRLRVQGLSSSLIRKKYLYTNFFFRLFKIWLYFVHLFCCFRPPARSFTHNSKELSSREKIS